VIRRPLRAGERLTDAEREALTARIRAQAQAAADAFRATDPRRRDYVFPDGAMTEDQRQADALSRPDAPRSASRSRACSTPLE
jgi:hypothetical protein